MTVHPPRMDRDGSGEFTLTDNLRRGVRYCCSPLPGGTIRRLAGQIRPENYVPCLKCGG